ncbi:2-hydroxychromene-2-carboxylate isomerase [Aerolutibacter ruishenii]|uniref:2-hydroxychromene-2-carboxylate isomerase n=1 Tax=Aerolutibacter ruishenii TaxID=686800 RepID=A0A562LKR2_9GAMM|nr:2-hydroxychromene-2-carboxylate isomerase [Lysobacter ruishenii]TWI08202.1 2-hydroxychromene-2-carboxylate isomerase [Lysobacter ruishenii]
MPTGPTASHVDWYFDFISPFAYLQWQAVKQFTGLDITYRPVLFAGLLSQLEHKGPAEIPAKRRFTYRHAQWRAERAGIPMVFPPAHPFNPLASLRLCLAAGAGREAVDAIFAHIWGRGQPGETFDELAPVARQLGVADAHAPQAPEVKQALRDNFEAAVAAGVFGVPTLAIDGQLFWGEDATAMFQDYLANPGLFETPSMRRVSDLPVGTARRIP